MLCEKFNMIDRGNASLGHLWLMTPKDYAEFLSKLSPEHQSHLTALGFKAEIGARAILPLAKMAFGVVASEQDADAANAAPPIWWLGDASAFLPADSEWRVAMWSRGKDPYAVAASESDGLSQDQADAVALGFILGSYQFEKFTPRKKILPRLMWSDAARRDRVTALAQAIYLARDVINCPPNHFGPAEMVSLAESLAKRHKAQFNAIIGDALLDQNYPLIHAVGRASSKPSALIDIKWGGADKNHPNICLVGKGVSFDSGGLDIKSSSGMILMKKDLGGAANLLGLGHAIMALNLPINLRILIPTVENMISGSAMRPSDVVTSRSGKSVEIGNTDAEGRLILADALTEADHECPDLLIDCATLTGAARVALGPEVPAYFTRQDRLAAILDQQSRDCADPLWRLPLWAGYRKQIDSKIADLHSTGESSFNGAISAALFLGEFVKKTTPWLHIDMMAWNPSTKPGRPEGGEAQTLRALLGLIENWQKA
ncbi:MAG: leucyl aminopeptidase family protein [Alphaproteobacteria bacterium]|nr:leucyl aminopeptidase family protein [Alphaproteobacteria bacterium]